MTDLLTRPSRPEPAQSPPPPPPHPHFGIASTAAGGVIVGIVAVLLAVGALAITAGRNSVDDALVAERVDALLADTEGTAAAPDAGGDVLPDLVPKAELGPVAPGEVNVSVAPQVPPASGRTVPALIEVHFEVVENVSVIDPATGVEHETWGYRVVGGGDGVVAGTPGPMIRGRVGDVLRFTLTNPEGNTNPHNVDFHAVTGPGGGAESTTVAPGETRTIEVRMLYPGLFMYHCAYGDIPAHIAHGMFGGILVDPETPLPAADNEWYVVQSEYYTDGATSGVAAFDRAAVTAEHPDYVVFNGARGALTGDNALHMAVGERSRIYFVNAGLNLTSNFHPIGSHWDAVYTEAALLNAPLRGSQTTVVPAGGGTVVDMLGIVPSTVVLVDHALTRAVDKGAIGQVVISGDANTEVFEDMSGDVPAEDGGGHDMSAPPAASEHVSIVPGSFEAQDMDHPDEFSDGEVPMDYSPNVLTVPVGTTVMWTNEDNQIHTVTEVDALFDSGFLEPGATWSQTFTEPGEFEYFCLPHPWMRGKVVVTE